MADQFVNITEPGTPAPVPAKVQYDSSAPDYDQHAHMVDIVKNGGTVMYNGVHYTSVNGLPTAMQLAGNDKEKQAKARAALEQELATVQSQLNAAKQAEDDAAKAADAAKEKQAEDDKAAAKATKEANDKAAASDKKDKDEK